MVEVNLYHMSNSYLINYLNFLISKIYKCLPMKENNEMTLQKYMESLLRELLGNEQLINNLKGNPLFISLIGKIEYLIEYDVDIKTYRKDIFDCISLIEKLKKGGLNYGDF